MLRSNMIFQTLHFKRAMAALFAFAVVGTSGLNSFPQIKMFQNPKLTSAANGCSVTGDEGCNQGTGFYVSRTDEKYSAEARTDGGCLAVAAALLVLTYDIDVLEFLRIECVMSSGSYREWQLNVNKCEETAAVLNTIEHGGRHINGMYCTQYMVSSDGGKYIPGKAGTYRAALNTDNDDELDILNELLYEKTQSATQASVDAVALSVLNTKSISETISETMATKSDLSDIEQTMATKYTYKDELEAISETMATKSDLETLANKSDVETIKSDLETMINKSDLEIATQLKERSDAQDTAIDALANQLTGLSAMVAGLPPLLEECTAARRARAAATNTNADYNTNVNDDSETSTTSSNGGLIAGIVIGILLGVGATVGAIFLWKRRSAPRPDAHRQLPTMFGNVMYDTAAAGATNTVPEPTSAC